VAISHSGFFCAISLGKKKITKKKFKKIFLYYGMYAALEYICILIILTIWSRFEPEKHLTPEPA
jgi:amino acid permease